jgi:hypothetical protein
MSQDQLDYANFVGLVIEALEAVGVEYLIGGAVAAWAWGEPRATLDLDLVIDLPDEAIPNLSAELGNRGMLVPAEIIRAAVLEERADLPIKAIHSYSGFKADLYPLRPRDELRRSAFERRIKVDLGPQIGEVYLHSPEDLIIYKLWYFSLSQQTKHLRDITAIAITLGDELDFNYIELWVNRKGLSTLWGELLNRIRSDSQTQ